MTWKSTHSSIPIVNFMKGHGEKFGREGFYIRREPSILAGICLGTFFITNHGINGVVERRQSIWQIHSSCHTYALRKGVY